MATVEAAQARSPLEERLKRMIAQDGPLSQADYMAICLHDLSDGYYATRVNLGAGGDFLTAPEISQMFGELIGLWAIEVWRALGGPPRVVLAELGPGSGALAADLMRAARLDPDFVQAVELWLVEVSPVLQGRQSARLIQHAPRFAARIEDLPKDAPLIVVGNEFLDCFGARAFVRQGAGWAERRIGLDEDGRLAFGLAPPPSGFAGPRRAPEGAVFEACPAQTAVAAMIGQLLAAQGGASLLIDYGRAAPEFGDTFQALRGRRRVDPLETPGAADLTVHVDFPGVAEAMRSAGVEVGPIVTQGAWLEGLGLHQRAEVLSRARPDLADTLRRQVARLTGPDQMGDLFKVLVAHSGLIEPVSADEP
jgi:NADH dehydrogenase [ubiquinone] 1 alpha subcomplex assembly factor 7